MSEQGYLRKNEDGRWEIIVDGRINDVLTSGSVTEVNVAGQWIRTRIEHFNDYYAVTKGIDLYEGMPARRPE